MTGNAPDFTQPDFTRAAYRDLLSALLARGYRGTSFSGVVPSRSDLLLRHDIDLWPEIALELARIESDLGLSAEYFFLMNSPLYDPQASAIRQVMVELRAMGHGVGLHFDAALYDDDPDVLDREAARECRDLEAYSEGPVTLVSFHRPAPSLLGRPEPIAGRAHSYQPLYFSDIGYCSDSRGAWRHGHPLDHPAVAKGRAIQLLTHPVWWATDCGGDRDAALAAFVAARGEWVKPAIAETVTGYSAEIGRIIEIEGEK
ncbi:hypothetical protein HH303_13960 [Rhodospirillaceae bacterium KN72]|uniref:Polysaccharide deacetylase n=1 Tax=Pacificispira spongiicola TaxID=2729598 RepID=A0A7Y0E1R8_9PROT|nr:hypothetical protein [Pacificispira spongiicola]NMM45596.1 hypothetical protein [Pacificispira spongiicola]